MGGERARPFDARLICATNRDLEEAVTAGRFRADLDYRINVLPVRVPPLRERPEDIPLLLTRYLREFAARFEVPITGFAPAAEEAALEWSWPGNVRELVNRVERAVALAERPVIGPATCSRSWSAGVAAGSGASRRWRRLGRRRNDARSSVRWP